MSFLEVNFDETFTIYNSLGFFLGRVTTGENPCLHFLVAPHMRLSLNASKLTYLDCHLSKLVPRRIDLNYLLQQSGFELIMHKFLG